MKIKSIFMEFKKDELKKILHLLIYIFALIGFLLTVGFFAIKLGITNTESITIDEQREKFIEIGLNTENIEKNALSFKDDAEWEIFKKSIIKDTEDIYKASMLADVPARLIVAQVAVEQMRLFYTNRDLFKSVFAPLKILGNQSQFSWGVVGIKQDTAISIENNLKNKKSLFYPGEKYENLLDFKTEDHDNERFERIVNDDNRFYSYLYTALYLKQIETQWKKSGFDISKNIGVMSTLFNIGFQNSKPNKDPKIGGAIIEINGKEYAFGYIAEMFYKSDELTDYFKK